jgi:DHA2 family multidrug resistance protein-like MFS transporter
MLATARLLGQSLGAVLVAIVLRISPGRGSNLVLWGAATVAVTAALISFSRLAAEPRSQAG